MDKKQRKIAEGLLTYSTYVIKELPISKEDFIAKISAAVDHNVYTMGNGGGGGNWNKARALTVANGMDADMWSYVFKGIEKELHEGQAEEQMASILVSKIHARFPNEDVDLRELVIYGKNCFGIKIYYCGKGFLFEYEGTIDELAKDICRNMEKIIGSPVKCPFCENAMPKHRWHEIMECTCSATVAFETTRPNNLQFVMGEIGAIRVIPKNETADDWAIWFLDKAALEKYDAMESAGSESYFEDKFKNYVAGAKYDAVSANDIKIEQPKDCPPIEKETIDEIIDEICDEYCVWVMSNKDYKISFPPNQYDHSGELNEIRTNKFAKIKKHETIGDWLEDSYTGEREASHCSGMGWFYATYSKDLIERFIDDVIFHETSEKLKLSPNDTIEDNDDDDDFFASTGSLLCLPNRRFA